MGTYIGSAIHFFLCGGSFCSLPPAFQNATHRMKNILIDNLQTASWLKFQHKHNAYSFYTVYIRDGKNKVKIEKEKKKTLDSKSNNSEYLLKDICEIYNN